MVLLICNKLPSGQTCVSIILLGCLKSMKHLLLVEQNGIWSQLVSTDKTKMANSKVENKDGMILARLESMLRLRTLMVVHFTRRVLLEVVLLKVVEIPSVF